MTFEEIIRLNKERVYNPNLTCSFDLLKTSDDTVWNVHLRNHDPGAIQPAQIAEQMWEYANVWTKRLIEHKIFGIEKNEKFPEVNILIMETTKGDQWSFIFASEEPITKSQFAIYLGEFAKDFAKTCNIKLKGLPHDAN